jgi:hypothetical protein
MTYAESMRSQEDGWFRSKARKALTGRAQGLYRVVTKPSRSYLWDLAAECKFTSGRGKEDRISTASCMLTGRGKRWVGLGSAFVRIDADDRQTSSLPAFRKSARHGQSSTRRQHAPRRPGGRLTNLTTRLTSSSLYCHRWFGRS